MSNVHTKSMSFLRSGESQSTGYLHPLYAQSLSEFGSPVELSACRGWVLKRPIHGTTHYDAMGCYPIFACSDWSRLNEDLDCISGELVALSLVTDPFGSYDHLQLQEAFKNIARPYKQHFIVDLDRRPSDFVAAHHQRNARKALKVIRVEVALDPIRFLDDWHLLYQNLIARHKISGMTAFSRSSFEKQLKVPGVIAFRALLADQTVGMLLWYIQEDVAYYHLGAYSAAGYEQNASFALFWTLLEYFGAAGVRWLSLGAGAGADGNSDDGLTRFKRGWSTGTRTAYFCGRIFDPRAYAEIVAVQNAGSTDYFPGYRSGEFG